MGLKIALCLYGLTGGSEGKNGKGASDKTLEIGGSFYKENMIKRNKIDVFVHSWSHDREEEVNKIYSPKKGLYEVQKKFKIPSYVAGSKERKQTHYSKWYSMMKSVELKKEYEVETGNEYDFVIVSRFDTALMKPHLFENYDKTIFYAGQWCTMVNKEGSDVFKGGRGELYENRENPIYMAGLKHNHIGYPHTNEGLIDQWFLSGSKNMDLFTSLYNSLDSYMKKNRCPLDVAKQISNHRLALHHLEQTGLVKKLKFTHCLFDDFPLIRRRFLGCKK